MRRRSRNMLLCIAVASIALLVFGCDSVIPNSFIWQQYQSVEFDGNGHTEGTLPCETITALAGSSIVIPDNTGSMVFETLVFDGWNTKPDGTGYGYEPGSTMVIPAKYTILYAQWKWIIGELGPAGGIVFYDKGNTTGGWRYLEVAPASTEWTDKAFGGSGTAVGGTSKTIGSGKSNSASIVAKYGIQEPALHKSDYAAKLCEDLVITSKGIEFTDWFLPSHDELRALYFNLKDIGKLIGFNTVDAYWSSSEQNESTDSNSALYAWYFYMSNGGYYNSKSFAERVRAVRAFL